MLLATSLEQALQQACNKLATTLFSHAAAAHDAGRQVSPARGPLKCLLSAFATGGCHATTSLSAIVVQRRMLAAADASAVVVNQVVFSDQTTRIRTGPS
jgi:hypothetical protein